MDLFDRFAGNDSWHTRRLLEYAGTLTEEQLDRPLPTVVELLPWRESNKTLRQLLENIIFTKEVWTAALSGADMDMNGPPKSQRSPQAMLQRLEKTDAELHRIFSDIRNRSAWDDTFVDALCEPAETFTFGGVFAHIMTFNAHRRLMALDALRQLGVQTEGFGDPMEYEESVAPWNQQVALKTPWTMRTELLRFNGAVERDPAIDAWMKEHAGELGAIAHQWFEVMRKCGDEVRELLHDGCPVACLGDAPFGYVNVFTSHVNVGFFHGAALPDPARLLQGTGKFMRHVKLRPGTATNATAISGLIDAAYEDIKARVEHG